MKTPTVSIIIPTLNEEKYLYRTISTILERAQDKGGLEVLVVDCGSSDHTLRSIAGLPAKTFRKPEFKFKKYRSLNFGMNQAQGEVLLFVDADTLLPEDFDRLILNKLDDPETIGGAFEFSFEEPDWKLLLVQGMNRIRYRFGQMYYGDQALFCEKTSAKTVGGFPAKKLMESAFFCKEMKKIGRLALVRKPIVTSPRRFVENGFFKVSWFDFSMWLRFLLNLPIEDHGERYWQANTKSHG